MITDMSRTPKASKGCTMMEMMISILVGLIVLAAVTMLYLGSSQSARFQTSVQRMEENGRIAIDLLSRNLRMAAYDDPLNTFEVEQPLMQGTRTSTGALITLPNLKSTADTIAVRYEGGSMIRDCLGTAVPAGTYVTNQFGVSTDDNLVCGTAADNSVALVEGVEDLWLRYGIDLDNDGFANHYVRAGNVADWNQVVTVEIALLVNSVTPALTSVDTVCLGCAKFSGTADHMIRAEYKTVIGVRNL